MGLFDSDTQSVAINPQTRPLSIPEGIVAISLLVSAIDGDCSDDEISILIAIMRAMNCFQGYDNDATSRMLRSANALLKRLTIDEYINQAVAPIPAEMRLSVFALAADIACVDGSLPQAEKDILNRLYQALDVTQEQGVEIMRVMQIRYKY